MYSFLVYITVEKERQTLKKKQYDSIVLVYSVHHWLLFFFLPIKVSGVKSSIEILNLERIHSEDKKMKTKDRTHEKIYKSRYGFAVLYINFKYQIYITMVW